MMLLKLLSIILLNLTTCFAVGPGFFWQADTSAKTRSQIQQGFNDALTLARVVAVTGKPCDPAFLRYFQPQDWPFVQGMFRQIANIPLNFGIDQNSINSLLQSFNTPAAYNPLFEGLSIAAGDNPYLEEGSLPNCGSSFPPNAYIQYDTTPSVKFSGLMSICPGAEVLTRRLDLADTENPPAWARVNNDPNGQTLPGWGCDGLGDHDNGFMTVTGSTVLHEFFHWPIILQGVPGYNTFIPPDSQGNHHIGDNTGTAFGLAHSYGPYNARLINMVARNPVTGKSQSIQNADNYVWYALSLYWSWKCGKPFGPSQSDADKNIIFERKQPPA
ncbi:hypothetical protein LTR10_022193 [Elasticomyces elasticus]|uniref:Lysine-specific metallo-endopeptidase domain-containing protein n=1 Tax=Exophiala sideris TaxID=1016849 RepID=A0ABR0J5K7_9EURO|nr:hypothetical protein LTR10_022193 [Elasticomyces elasticus]KAK5026839.1 hypothetical protein LTS07_007137 [Exophiala sideris]KAK5033843.1 hypothetical protein LTR13_006442 [Exophiala sideris]KAK5055882.1 hypothetical protein LTR69_008258 [Exophiala sideris]KAK5180785.1 hypothetical protein LTR44_006604 [Eurotiomycetes sp. CCFEE 6388]